MIIWRQLWSILWLTESSGLSLLLLGAMSTDMMRFDIYMQELLPAATNSETKKHSVKNLLNSRVTFRLWQILVFLFVMTIIITVTRILAATFGPASPCYKISTKEDRGNLTFLLLRYLAFSASILHSSRLLNLRNRASNHIPKTTRELN